MPTYKTRTGTQFRACDWGCARAFLADRRVGLIYGPYKKPDGGFYLNAEAMSMATGLCPYCGTRVKRTREPASVRVKRGIERFNQLAPEGWRAMVTVNQVNMAHPILRKKGGCCVSAMVFGTYLTALAALNLDPESAIRYGLNIYFDEPFADLTREWRKQLRRRK